MAHPRLDDLRFRLKLGKIGCDALGDAHPDLRLRLTAAQEEHAILCNVDSSLSAKTTGRLYHTNEVLNEVYILECRVEELEDEIGRINAKIISELDQKKPI